MNPKTPAQKPTEPSRWSASDRLFWAVFSLGTALSILPWWLSDILPMQDLPHFLTLVRALQEYRTPDSPFFGTYTLESFFAPLALPMWLTTGFAYLIGIENASRLVLSLYAVALPTVSLYLIRMLNKNRWNVLVSFALIFGKWTSSGFFAYVTGLPLMLLAIGLNIAFLRRPTISRGVALALAVPAVFIWHGLVFCQTLLALGTLWVLWKAPNLKQRLVSLWPLMPIVLIAAIWAVVFFQVSHSGRGQVDAAAPWAYWDPFQNNAKRFFKLILMQFPGQERFVYVGLGLLVTSSILAWSSDFRRSWAALRSVDGFRIDPFFVLAIVFVCAYFTLPSSFRGLEIINTRLAWVIAAFVPLFWRPPAHAWMRFGVYALIAGLIFAYLIHMSQRFSAFHQETVGASRLIDKMKPRQTLIAPIIQAESNTEAFRNNPLREVQQIATVRQGGLPTTSFASTRQYVSFVGDRNPMPRLTAYDWWLHPALTKFDYVLLWKPRPRFLRLSKIRLLDRDGEWYLFSVCGSQAFPSCP